MQTQHIEFLQLLNGQVQFVVPRWQRRYCWQQSDIERLVEDILAIADATEQATHYAGTLLTFPEPGPPGVLPTHRLVDGQQRLTTVSILLACIAAKLGPDGKCGHWDSEFIRYHRLTNAGIKSDKHRRKLRLQDGDEEEYRSGLAGNPTGAGAVAQAWRIAHRLVGRYETARLLAGLEKLQVVSIALGSSDDPQQIFESLNATGRPLTESEKVKNWLLIGLEEEEQGELHDRYWKSIEQALGAEHSSQPIDMFLRDVMRWRTGEVQGTDKTYEQFRRWSLRMGRTADRPSLCKELARLAPLYGKLTGTSGKHSSTEVSKELRHLREMGFDVHRPLTLRMLDEASGGSTPEISSEELAGAVGAIGTWITRLWLSGRPTAGMNKGIAELAFGAGPADPENFAQSWIDRIRRLRNQRIGAPRDQEVIEGIQGRKAYGGSATKSAFAVLCELMEQDELQGEAPSRQSLTIEHIMPQKLTDQWKRYLGDNAIEVHSQYRDQLANLTLSGSVPNATMGTDPFDVKRKVYSESSIRMTRRLAQEAEWNAETLERRSEDLAYRALLRWPWHDDADQSDEAPLIRWQIADGPWHSEPTGRQSILNLTSALLDLDSDNVHRLQGTAITSNIHPASRYPSGSKVGGCSMVAIPGHAEWVINPYEQHYVAYAKRCQQLGQRCGVAVEVELRAGGVTVTEEFWTFLMESTGGVPGQKENWRGGSQRSTSCNEFGDCIGFYIGNPDTLWLNIRAGIEEPVTSQERMRQFSWDIQEQLPDQRLSEDVLDAAKAGRSIRVERSWTRDNRDDWAEVAQWIEDQFERLRSILAAPHLEEVKNPSTLSS